MARSRILKPGFFTNEVLAELPFEGRLLFAGLWTLADKEGRIEDRPKRIKAALFPWDDVMVDDLLTRLTERGFLLRYQAEGVAVIQIATFTEHQHPHIRENPSDLPGPEKAGTSLEKPGRARERLPVTTSVSDPVSNSVISTAAEPEPFLTFPTAGKPDSWLLCESQIAEWQGLYPSLDIRAECRKAYAWVTAKKGHKKTVRGMAAFLVNWFSRSTDRGGERRPEVRGSSDRQSDRGLKYEWNCPHTPHCPHRAACAIVSARKVTT